MRTQWQHIQQWAKQTPTTGWHGRNAIKRISNFPRFLPVLISLHAVLNNP